MKITIRGDKIAVTGAIKEYVTENLVKLDKYFEQPDEIKAFAVIKVKNRLQTIEVTVPTSRFTLRAEVSHEDLYAAVDLVIDVLERQIRKNKTRLNNRLKDTQVAEFNLNYEIESDEEDNNKIIKRKDIDMKPMDEEEALLQLNLLDHDFFVFKNIDEECISVIYKRKDGKFGILNSK